MESLIEDLRTSIPSALETQEHKTRIQEIEQETKEFQNRVFQQLTDRAQALGIQVIRTHAGFALAPTRDGKVLSPEEYDVVRAEKKKIQREIERLQEELQALVAKLPRWRREARERIKQANQDTARFALEHLMKPLQEAVRGPGGCRRVPAAGRRDVIETPTSSSRRMTSPSCRSDRCSGNAACWRNTGST
jgi:hypothetical protein